MYGVPFAVKRVEPAERAFGGPRRIGRPHEFPVTADGVLAFKHGAHHGAGGHVVHEAVEKGTLPMHGVKTFGLRPSHADHLESRDGEPGPLDTD